MHLNDVKAKELVLEALCPKPGDQRSMTGLAIEQYVIRVMDLRWRGMSLNKLGWDDWECLSKALKALEKEAVIKRTGAKIKNSIEWRLCAQTSATDDPAVLKQAIRNVLDRSAR